ncbi:response regulator transcription factor [Brevundimonas subvibrioides]|uniref:Response regulator receiver protein n=1 Tax=Brevundimonas subvibrioides (strain ATCC 15264 / DSM 4735 / LMG 14903 / NBRC 16000 / CB 81) TaxID=633149 RepID=D9QF15_BRESC|nr:response regulator [Brevundimonas subvibrioides]ADL00500.1 response regulator receiver protein [Brevundimonas subvibrioides ATCC 15264]
MTGLAIHIVDDDAPFRDSLAFALMAHDFDVTSHGDPAAFLLALPEDQPACVVCDIRMPGLSGIEVARALRARVVPVHVILVTGHADRDLVARATEAGAMLVLEKPFAPQRLIEVLVGLAY